MTSSPEQALKTVILPPRPNLGPEPLPPLEDPALVGLAWTVVACLLALLAIGWLFLRRRRKAPSTEAPRKRPSLPQEPVDLAVDSVVSAAEQARRLVAHRFGHDWLARTTDELLDDPAVTQTLHSSTRSRLEALLLAADRVKFAARNGEPVLDQGWDELLSTLRSELSTVDPSATRSTMTGR
jgi:hypothetical protein